MNNIQLSTSIYYSKSEALATVIVVHGMSEHQVRYAQFAETLSKNGYNVVTYDQRGHGKTANSKKDLGYFGENGWQNFVDDLDYVVSQTKKEFSEVPVVLFGHSMGSMVVRSYLKEHDKNIAGVILSGAPNYQGVAKAGLVLAKLVCLFKGEKSFSSLLHNLSVGAFNKAIDSPRTELDWLSYNEDNVDTYINDPLCGFMFTNRGYQNVMEGVIDLHNVIDYRYNNHNLPILFVAGVDDPCTGGEKGLADSIDTLKDIGYKDIEKRIYDRARHEILFEDCSNQVIEDILVWLNNKIK